MTARITSCFSYPLKSGHAASETEAAITATGIAGDRRFMLVDKTGHFLNQKQLPELAVITMDKLAAITPLRITNRKIPVTVYNGTVNAFRAADETNIALSSLFNRAVTLVAFPLNEKRALEAQFSRPEDTTMFADEFPLLVTSQSSLDVLAPHFRSAVTMDRFRPNIVIDGLPPFAEDTLKHIRIGKEVELEIVKNCARCAITMIDQATGQKAGPEPLATLNQLRKGEKSAYFGAYAIPRVLGTIRPGDTVEILDRRPICPDMARTKINGLQF